MKNLFVLLLIAISFVGCKKKEILTKYIIVVNKDNPYKATLKVNDVLYSITDTYYQGDITIKEYDVVSVSLDYVSTQDDVMELSVLKEGAKIASISGNRYMWIVFSNTSSSQGGGYSSSGSGSGSGSGSSTWHYCGAPTKDGTPCQRHVSGTSGYCWQHK